jgi:hypothetical protein
LVDEKKEVINLLGLSVADADPHESAFSLAPGSGFGFGMRIRIQLLRNHQRQKLKFTVISEFFKQKIKLINMFFLLFIIICI